MNGAGIAGRTYSVGLTLQSLSEAFTFTVAADEQLPKAYDFQWDTGSPITTQVDWGMSFKSGWSRTPSIEVLLYYFARIFPEFLAAVILAVTILVPLLAYRLVSRRKTE